MLKIDIQHLLVEWFQNFDTFSHSLLESPHIMSFGEDLIYSQLHAYVFIYMFYFPGLL